MCFSIGMVLTSCGDNENHEHTYKTEWTYDDTYHWHACEGEDCTDVSDKAEHTWNDGEITTEATAEADGVKTFTCTVCGNTKTEVVKYVAQDVDKSGYSIFNEEDHYCIVKHNQIGLPVEVYSESAFSGERDYGDRDLEWSIEYTSDNLISSIVSSYRHYEFEYNNDYTYAYGVAYQNNAAKKVEDGRTIVISYSADKQIEAINAYSTTGLLSQYVFNEKGQVIRLIEQDEVSIYKYDEYGRLVTCEMFDISADGSATSELLTLNYNGDATLPSGFVWSEDGVICWEGTEITYDENGQVLTCTCTYYDGSECDGSLTCISSFDEYGRLVNYQEIYKSAEEEEGVYTELTYNSHGLLNEEARFDIVGDNKILSSKNSFEYDDNGNCTRETYTYYAEDGVTAEGTSTTTYTYNENNQITSEFRGNGEGNRYTYDSNGLMISEVYVFEDGSESLPREYQWLFDDEGRLIEIITKSYYDREYDEDTGKEILKYDSSTCRYSYNSDGHLSAYFDDSGHEYRFEYDADGRINAVSLTYQYERWSDSLNDYEQKTGTGTNTYTYSENGELISAVICEWDYENECYVAITYDYTTIK